MASRDTTRAPSQGFNEKVAAVLRDPSNFPPEFDAHVRSLIVRNPLVKIEPFQLPTLDKKHVVGAAGELAVFQNSWAKAGSGFEDPCYWKDSASCVHLQGLMTGGAAGTTAFTLPTLYRPVGQLVFVVAANVAGAVAAGRIDVFNDGEVVVQSGATPISLSGISFRIL